MGCAGGWVIWTVKESAGKDHVTTWHALVGVLTLALSLINAANGAPIVYSQVRDKMLRSCCLGLLFSTHRYVRYAPGCGTWVISLWAWQYGFAVSLR